MLNMKRVTLFLGCTLLTACGDPIVGSWLGTEICNGTGEASCTDLPFEDAGRTASLSMIVEKDLTGELVLTNTIESTTDEQKTPIKIQQEESAGAYAMTLLHDEEFEQALSCILENKELTCSDDSGGMTLEKE